jgi:DNA-binding response OmpR family regulator
MENTTSVSILIVEDDLEIRILLSEVFKIEKYEVLQASDGEEAIRIFEAHKDRIKLVITDLGLPKLGGVDLITKVRALNPQVKIIGSSGYGRVNINEEVLQAGGDVFIPKPYLTTELLKTVKALLSNSELQR